MEFLGAFGGIGGQREGAGIGVPHFAQPLGAPISTLWRSLAARRAKMANPENVFQKHVLKWPQNGPKWPKMAKHGQIAAKQARAAKPQTWRRPVRERQQSSQTIALNRDLQRARFQKIASKTA